LIKSTGVRQAFYPRKFWQSAHVWSKILGYPRAKGRKMAMILVITGDATARFSLFSKKPGLSPISYLGYIKPHPHF
jgi:hypothetical protein